MYKDKQKQREANKERQRRYRESKKGVISEGVTEQGVTLIEEALVVPDGQIPSAVVRPQVERDGKLADKSGSVFAYQLTKQGWQATQFYAELFYRLTHWSLEKLKESGHWIPVWREALG
jgi:hypothetical protein